MRATSPRPVWFNQLRWEGPFPFTSLLAAKAPWPGLDTKGSGVYMFTADRKGLLETKVLYIGKADGAKQTLKRRVGAYVSRFRSKNSPAKPHTGMELLFRYYQSNPTSLHIRWAGCASARDLEGGLIDYYNPTMNTRFEEVIQADDEEIAPEYL